MMSNCGACDLGAPHEHNGYRYQPAVFLYGSASAEDAARYWYNEAIKVAKEYNALQETLEGLRKHWIVRTIERHKS